MPQLQPQGNFVQGGLHFGGALQHLVSKYPTLMSVVKEQVQNSIDKKAKNIRVLVNFDRRELEHCDDGEGADRTFSEKALGTIGQTTKNLDQYGRYGIGLVAGLSCFERYTFTSSTVGQGFYMMWTFDRKHLFGSTSSFRFPCETRRGIHNKAWKHHPSGSQAVWWSTQIFMKGMTEDKKKSDINLDDLSHEIQSEFSKKMLEFGISVTVSVVRDGKEEKKVIHGKAFQGKKLELWTGAMPSGNVRVQAYLAPPGVSGPVRIVIGAAKDLFRLTWQKFTSSSGYKYLQEDTRNALGSGLFQGEIISDGIVLTSTRRSFEDSDALMELGLALDEWFDKVGRRYLADEKASRARERYQDLGTEVVNSLSWMYEGKDAVFAKLVHEARYGTVGKGHAPTGTEIPGYIMKGTTTPSTPRGQGDTPSGERESARTPKPNHSPKVAIGPKGGERTVVEGNSKGPHILFHDFDGSNALWKFDKLSLCLQINITHPDFVAVEKSDYKVKALAEQIFLTAFQLELQEPDYRMHAEKFAAEILSAYTVLLSKGTIARKFTK